MEIKTEQGLFLRFRIDDDELYKILDELKNAEETIQKCYWRLHDIGVVEVTRKRTAPEQKQSVED